MPGPPLIYHACHTRGIHLQVLAAGAVQSSIIYLSPNTSVLVRYVLCLSCSQLFKIMNLAPIDPRWLSQPATAEIKQLLGSFMQVRRVQEDLSSTRRFIKLDSRGEFSLFPPLPLPAPLLPLHHCFLALELKLVACRGCTKDQRAGKVLALFKSNVPDANTTSQAVQSSRTSESCIHTFK